jgi:hypothetical protein
VKSKKTTIKLLRYNKLTENTIISLKDRLGDRKLGFWGNQKFNIALVMNSVRKKIINYAGALSKFISLENKNKQKSAGKNYILRMFSNALMFVGVSVFALGGVFAILKHNPEITQLKMVAGAVSKEGGNNSLSKNESGFDKWIYDKTGAVTTEDQDNDLDGMTNYEEFLANSNPENQHTCDPIKKDSELLIDFVKPSDCQKIDWENDKELEVFSQLIDIDTLKNNPDITAQQSIQENNNEIPSNQKIDKPDTVQEVFGATNLKELNQATQLQISTEADEEKLRLEIERTEMKKQYLAKIDKINSYMESNRSLEPYDRNYDIPVNGSVYIQVAEEYRVPLKYVLAIAQRESRFGTDRYNKAGFLTRPGQYENIVSMGLDDSGGNISYGSWEESLRSFGKWYRRFDDAGVSDCRKWKIYNPNGDYCKAVEETASEIEYFLTRN